MNMNIRKSDYRYLNTRLFKYNYIDEIAARLKRIRQDPEEAAKEGVDIEAPRKYLNFEGLSANENPPAPGGNLPLRAENLLYFMEALMALRYPMVNTAAACAYLSNKENEENDGADVKGRVFKGDSDDLYVPSTTGGDGFSVTVACNFFHGGKTSTSIPDYTFYPEGVESAVTAALQNLQYGLTETNGQYDAPVVPVCGNKKDGYGVSYPYALGWMLKSIEITDDEIKNHANYDRTNEGSIAYKIGSDIVAGVPEEPVDSGVFEDGDDNYKRFTETWYRGFKRFTNIVPDFVLNDLRPRWTEEPDEKGRPIRWNSFSQLTGGCFQNNIDLSLFHQVPLGRVAFLTDLSKMNDVHWPGNTPTLSQTHTENQFTLREDKTENSLTQSVDEIIPTVITNTVVTTNGVLLSESGEFDTYTSKATWTGGSAMQDYKEELAVYPKPSYKNELNGELVAVLKLNGKRESEYAQTHPFLDIAEHSGGGVYSVNSEVSLYVEVNAFARSTIRSEDGTGRKINRHVRGYVPMPLSGMYSHDGEGYLYFKRDVGEMLAEFRETTDPFGFLGIKKEPAGSESAEWRTQFNMEYVGPVKLKSS